MDVSKIAVRMHVDTAAMCRRLNTLALLQKSLKAQLPFEVNTVGFGDHFLPILKPGVSRKEFGKLFATEFFRVFDAACIDHCLESLKIGILGYETIGH